VCVETGSRPDKLPGNNALDAIVNSHQQCAAIIDTDRDAFGSTGAGGPRDARARRGRREPAPRVEDSIEPPGQQILLAPRERHQSFNQH
jgi:hypothetical protein